MIRFFWKEINDPDTQFNKAQATKICRTVDFSLKLDLFDLCTEELKGSLQAGRLVYEENKKAEEELYKKEYEEFKKTMHGTLFDM
jgi:hypothetical protein